MGFATEVRDALAATAPFLLSHHLPADRHRCYAPVVFGRRWHVCARCSGIYPGIAAGAVAPVVTPASPGAITLIALLPLPTLIDWAVTTFTGREGYNGVRTATGAVLGYGYGLGLRALWAGPALPILLVGALYAFVAGVLVYVANPGT